MSRRLREGSEAVADAMVAAAENPGGSVMGDMMQMGMGVAMAGQMANQMGGMMGGGGFMSVAPEQVSKLKVTTVCLEHGKPDPNPKMAYKIVRHPARSEELLLFAEGLDKPVPLEVDVDGKNIFSKKELNRFPEDGEIAKLLS